MMRRRDFLRTAALSGPAMMSGGLISRARAVDGIVAGPRSNVPRLPMRPFGKTGVNLSVIGFPGFALKELDQKRVERMVAIAVEKGMNYFDVAPQYGDAEERLGPALEPYRKEVFLACKTHHRDREGAEADLKASFEKLRTDHFELYQLHHIGTSPDDVDRAFARGGAMETLIQAKQDGRVRFLGFSAHSIEAALTAMDRYDFDSALFPINFACEYAGHWGSQITARAQEKGVVCLALKPFARQKWQKDAVKLERYRRCWYEPITDLDEADLSLRWTLGQPVTAAIPPAAEFLFAPAMHLAMDYTPIKPEEEQRLKTLAGKLDPLFVHHA